MLFHHGYLREKTLEEAREDGKTVTTMELEAKHFESTVVVSLVSTATYSRWCYKTTKLLILFS